MNEHLTQSRSLLIALPIFEYDSAPHLHSLVLNQGRDAFEMPCRDSVDQSLDEMVSQLAGALADPKAIVVPDADCIEMLWPLGNGVGARVCTAVRIKQDRFSIINWKAGSGQRPSAADVDPPFAFAQLYRQPEAWLGHRRAIRSAWRGKSSYDQCRHRRA